MAYPKFLANFIVFRKNGELFRSTIFEISGQTIVASTPGGKLSWTKSEYKMFQPNQKDLQELPEGHCIIFPRLPNSLSDTKIIDGFPRFTTSPGQWKSLFNQA